MLIRFDRFLHDRVFNPLVRLIQRRLHVNRYHVLFASEILSEALFFLTVVVGSLYRWVTKHDAFYALMFLFGAWILHHTYSRGSFARVIEAMRETAARFEERGFAKPPVELILLAVRRRFDRPVWNVVSVAMILIRVAASLLGIHADWLDMMFTALFANFLFNKHLWDVDDLDPRDREYLFQKQSQTQT
ncbi:hypothetical protein EBS80_02390 [bacterium]|nr:hypothetical protein [bacterium]